MFGSYSMISWAWVVFGIVWLLSGLTSKRTVRRQTTSSRVVQIGLLLLAGLYFRATSPGGRY